MILRFGQGRALQFFDITSLRGPDHAGAVFGDLVYHNQFATQGEHRAGALAMFREEAKKYHPDPEFAV